jgi:hypothetical protein
VSLAPSAQILSILAQLAPNHPQGASRMLAIQPALRQQGDKPWDRG